MSKLSLEYRIRGIVWEATHKMMKLEQEMITGVYEIFFLS